MPRISFTLIRNSTPKQSFCSSPILLMKFYLMKHEKFLCPSKESQGSISGSIIIRRRRKLKVVRKSIKNFFYLAKNYSSWRCCAINLKNFLLDFIEHAARFQILLFNLFSFEFISSRHKFSFHWISCGWGWKRISQSLCKLVGNKNQCGFMLCLLLRES